ncbi:MAG: hypothetical protein EA382_16635 [Spirochaetaceae bacterium]|nr:MAG: hypothetical protein EA382_16635 [Spirochaetaceae bacterium]
MMKSEGSNVGTMVFEFGRPNIARILKSAGLDFFIIDCEHGNHSWETVEDIVSVANAVGITPLVRVPTVGREQIAKALDCGAKGIVVPQIRTVEQVKQTVQYARYPPLGQRGVALMRGNTGFEPVKSSLDYMRSANENLLILPQIETNEALEHIEEIASIDGISGLFLGAVDLSVANGLEHPFEDSTVQNAFTTMMEVCKRNRILSAAHLNNLEVLRTWIAAGLNLVSYNADAMALMNAYRSSVEYLKRPQDGA